MNSKVRKRSKHAKNEIFNLKIEQIPKSYLLENYLQFSGNLWWFCFCYFSSSTYKTYLRNGFFLCFYVCINYSVYFGSVILAHYSINKGFCLNVFKSKEVFIHIFFSNVNRKELIAIRIMGLKPINFVHQSYWWTVSVKLICFLSVNWIQSVFLMAKHFDKKMFSAVK